MTALDAIPAEDTVCACGHWYDEHDCPMGADPQADAFCAAPGCTCEHFTPSAELSSPEAIADRGGNPDLWPEHVKQAFTQEARP